MEEVRGAEGEIDKYYGGDSAVKKSRLVKKIYRVYNQETSKAEIHVI